MLRVVTLALLFGGSARAASLTTAVLYFDNQTGDPQYDVFQKGLADMIITDLAAVPGVTVVERARLQEVLTEQALQHTRFFDPATAVKTGKLVGASHVILGSIAAVAPTVRLDIKLVDVKKGTVLATSQVSGPGSDMFALEEQLVQTFVTTLALKKQIPAPANGRVSTDSVLAYSKGLDQADHGDVKGARTTMVALMQSAPDFTLAKTRYTELLQQVAAATERRTEVLSDDERELRAHMDKAIAQPLSRLPRNQRSEALAWRYLAIELALRRLADVAGRSPHGNPVVVPVKKLGALTEPEDAVIAAYDRLEADLLTVPDENRGWYSLPHEDLERARSVFGDRFQSSYFISVRDVREDRAELLLEGTHRQAQLDYRPTAALRRPMLLEPELSRLKLEEKDDGDGALRIAEVEASGLLAAGRKVDAVAAYQRFLDAHPRSTNFEEAKTAIEDVLMVSEKVKTAASLLDKCDSGALITWQAYFRTVTRVERRAGVDRLLKKVEGCAAKQGQNAMGWRVNGALFGAVAGLELGDCALVNEMRKKVKALGPAWAGSLQTVKGCEQ